MSGPLFISARPVSETIGRLGSRIQRVALPDGRFAWLKLARRGGPEDLDVERARLQWIDGRLPAPVVLEAGQLDDDDYLIISELPGAPSHAAGESLDAVLRALADGLAMVHALPAGDCPFQADLDAELAEAQQLLARGRIDERAFIEENGCAPAPAMRRLVELVDTVPRRQGVWTHGDYCLPNVLMEQGRLSGIVDWGLAKVGDPARDLALLEGSIRFNLGQAAVERFYAVRGVPRPDGARIELFDLLDQFFTHLLPAGEIP